MSRNRSARGAALIEFAIALPFTLTLFIGIGDFTAYFWSQTQMEEVARLALSRIVPALDGYASADAGSFEKYENTIQESLRRETGRKELAIKLSRHYACPLPSGAEQNLFTEPQLCQGERVYLRVASDQPVAPLLAPLRLIGYPSRAFSRHVIRIR
ncbi:MAG: pilus assembly protein [Acidobacteria bacterium]|nr:pilus assembly protein [Acidobacteriota bacterium]